MDIPDKNTLLTRLKHYLSVFDGPLALIIFLIMSVGIITLYSAGIDFPGRVEDQLRNIIFGFIIMWIAGQCPATDTDAFCRSGIYLRNCAIARSSGVRACQKRRATLAEYRYCHPAV